MAYNCYFVSDLQEIKIISGVVHINVLVIVNNFSEVSQLEHLCSLFFYN